MQQFIFVSVSLINHFWCSLIFCAPTIFFIFFHLQCVHYFFLSQLTLDQKKSRTSAHWHLWKMNLIGTQELPGWLLFTLLGAPRVLSLLLCLPNSLMSEHPWNLFVADTAVFCISVHSKFSLIFILGMALITWSSAKLMSDATQKLQKSST